MLFLYFISADLIDWGHTSHIIIGLVSLITSPVTTTSVTHGLCPQQKLQTWGGGARGHRVMMGGLVSMIFSLSSRIVEAAESNVSGPASNEHSMLWMNTLRLVFHRHRNSTTHQSPSTTHHSPYTVCHASGKTLLYKSGKKVCSWPPHALEQTSVQWVTVWAGGVSGGEGQQLASQVLQYTYTCQSHLSQWLYAKCLFIYVFILLPVHAMYSLYNISNILICAQTSMFMRECRNSLEL